MVPRPAIEPRSLLASGALAVGRGQTRSRSIRSPPSKGARSPSPQQRTPTTRPRRTPRRCCSSSGLTVGANKSRRRLPTATAPSRRACRQATRASLSTPMSVGGRRSARPCRSSGVRRELADPRPDARALSFWRGRPRTPPRTMPPTPDGFCVVRTSAPEEWTEICTRRGSGLIVAALGPGGRRVASGLKRKALLGVALPSWPALLSRSLRSVMR